MDPLDLFQRGGILMWPILGCSIIAVAFFIERMLALRRRNILPPSSFASLCQHLEARDHTRAIHMCREQANTLCRIALSGLTARGRGRQHTKVAMEEAGGVAVGQLERGVSVLSTIAAIAPLLGLLGTVTGMIKVFRDVAGTINPDIAILARGIWEALITTGAGLTVAIPTYVAYRYVEERIARYERELEEATLSILELVTADDLPVEAKEMSPNQAESPQ